MTFTVSAPLIAVTADGVRHSLYFGAVVPSGVKGDDLDRLEAGGFIRRDGAPMEPSAAGGDAPAAEAVSIPAKSGPGSGAAAWHGYAASVGVTVPEAADRAAVIEAIEAAGLPVE